MKRGIQFELPNEYGTFLGDILKPIDLPAFNWQIGSGESYKEINNEVGSLFPEGERVMEGNAFKRTVESGDYYVIFAELQAFPKGKTAEISTYDEFMKSDCELVLLVADSRYATIYCKDLDNLELLFRHAHSCGFTNVEYVTDENDTRNRLSVW